MSRSFRQLDEMVSCLTGARILRKKPSARGTAAVHGRVPQRRGRKLAIKEGRVLNSATPHFLPREPATDQARSANGLPGSTHPNLLYFPDTNSRLPPRDCRSLPLSQELEANERRFYRSHARTLRRLGQFDRTHQRKSRANS